jgi:hypothetical protein
LAALLTYGREVSPGGTDLNADFRGYQSVDVSLLSFDQPNSAELFVSLIFTSSSVGPIATLVGGEFTTGPGAQVISISLAGASSTLLGDVDGIRVLFGAPTAADFRVDSIVAVVPEPASTLAALFAAGWLLRRSRR